MAKITQIKVNGTVRKIDAESQWTLLTVLRDQLDLTGAKYGCGEGQCGACTVLIDGVAKRSCRTQIGLVGDNEVTTIEGLAVSDHLHPLQQAFLDEAAMQCAYCTSGMIMSAAALLNSNHAPSTDDILQAMEGNICRCGAYPRIVSAIQKAAKAMPAPEQRS
ncbi:MAG TPA: (2Fe-2S)-binding protein [Candidatus Sulfotelmatobacter sp.]|jgi:nicotinate dehydrogenase subunit A|nr:(2Fe-2S)-binding protein [Candidatus Sulfotelmatobacter sp.]